MNTNVDYSMIKYPRTPHLEGSRLQEGDEDLSQIPFDAVFGRHLVIEEKIDGANTAVSFDGEGNLLLQSRGHYLRGGHRERHYNRMKQWAISHTDLLLEALGSRYVMYGEWMYAKHTVFYDALPDYFMEFDIYDREREVFLSTENRRRITEPMGIIHSVPVLAEGVFQKKEEVLSYLGESKYISPKHWEVLKTVAERHGLDPVRQQQETDPSRQMEGLYFKIEEEGVVKERMKFVRASFLQCLTAAQGHWQQRPILPNQLAEDWQ